MKKYTLIASFIAISPLLISLNSYGMEHQLPREQERVESIAARELIQTDGAVNTFFLQTLYDWGSSLITKALSYTGEAGGKLVQLVGQKNISLVFENLKDQGYENLTAEGVGKILSSVGSQLAHNIAITSRAGAKSLIKTLSGYPIVDEIIGTTVGEVVPELVQDHIISPLSTAAYGEMKKVIRELIWLHVYVKSGFDADWADEVSGIPPSQQMKLKFIAKTQSN